VGTGTQIDGLGHIGVDNVYYNCNRNSDFVQANGITKLGVEKVPNFVTRAVLLDMAAHYGRDVVPEGTAFNRKEIDEVAAKQGVEIRRGDVVLFHTGWLSLVGKEDKRYISGEPGLGKDGALYLASKEVVAVGADTWGLEAIPFEPGVGVFEVHQILIPPQRHLHPGEHQDGRARPDRAYEFMFVLGASRITGGRSGDHQPDGDPVGGSKCLIPRCGGTLDHHAARDALWARFFTEAPARRSGCVGNQAAMDRHGVWSRTMAFRTVSSFRITATRATFLGRPRVTSRS
jgi:hypothetical protein